MKCLYKFCLLCYENSLCTYTSTNFNKYYKSSLFKCHCFLRQKIFWLVKQIVNPATLEFKSYWIWWTRWFYIQYFGYPKIQSLVLRSSILQVVVKPWETLIFFSSISMPPRSINFLCEVFSATTHTTLLWPDTKGSKSFQNCIFFQPHNFSGFFYCPLLQNCGMLFWQ